MTRTELLALAGLLAAVGGYFIRYAVDTRLAQRKDRLKRVNRQLSDFYGPLLALTRASDESWQAFRQRYRPIAGSFWRPDSPPARDEVLAWRLWMTTVFVPVHQSMMDLVLNHADLIEESDMPDALLTLCAHVAGYQAVIEAWKADDISLDREDNVSVVNFPGEELADYAAQAFARLKAEQCKLLGARTLMVTPPFRRHHMPRSGGPVAKPINHQAVRTAWTPLRLRS